MSSKALRQIAFVGLAAITTLLVIEPALASSGGGGSLPWEGPLETIKTSITGPVAGAVALIAVAVAGGMLIFGAELSDFGKKMVNVVLVAGLLLGASQVVALFSSSGASIDVVTTASLVLAHG